MEDSGAGYSCKDTYFWTGIDTLSTKTQPLIDSISTQIKATSYLMITMIDNNPNSKEIVIISELSTFKISFLLQELLGESITKYYLQWNGIFIIGISYLYTTCYISSLRNETKIV